MTPTSVAASPAAPARPAPSSISVVICAYTQDRWPDLVAAHASVHGQLAPVDEIIVVIDHNEALLRAALTLPVARVLENTGPRGLSGARNTGVAASDRAIVAFLDDDAAASPGWLASVRDGFRDPAVMALGSAVEAGWVGGRAPRWFPPEFGWVVGCGYRGQPVTRSDIRNPIGAAMAIRRSAFAVAGGFSERVGRIGALPVGCEETEFCIRLSRTVAGARVIHEPSGSVRHTVPPARRTLRYFVRRCFHEGRSKWAVTRMAGSRAGLAAERRYVRVVLPTGFLTNLYHGISRLDVFALARAFAIGIGLTSTLAGFLSAALLGVTN